MATDSAMKIKVAADVSDVKKGLKQASDDVALFDKTAKGSLTSLATALGVNIDKINEVGRAFAGAAAKVASASGASANKVLSISSAIGGVGLAMGAVVGTVVAAWKQMDSHAQHYLGTLEGIASAEASRAYRDTYKNYIADQIDGGAENASKVNSGKEWWTRFVSNLQLSVAAQTGNLDKGGMTLAEIMNEAESRSERVRVLQREITEAALRQMDVEAKLLELQAERNELMAAMRNTSLSVEERRKALTRVEEINDEIYSKQYTDAKLIADNLVEINKLSSTNLESKRKEVDAINRVVQLDVQRTAAGKELTEVQNSLNKAGGQVLSTTEKIAEATKEWSSSMSDLDAFAFGMTNFKELEEAATEAVDNLDMSLHSDDMYFDTTELKLKATEEISDAIKEACDDAAIDLEDYEIEIDPKLQIKAEAYDNMLDGISGAIVSFGTDIASAFGDAIGGALSGDTGAWDDFGTDILASLGSFATRLGELLIGFGTAGFAIKNFISDPKTALIAGGVLVALGAALSSAASNMASGNYTSATTYTSSSSSSATSGSDYTERELNITVSGKMVASGNQLLAVIDNENSRRQRTT